MRHNLIRLFIVVFIGLGAAVVGAAQTPSVVQAVAPIYPLVPLSARATGTVIVEAQVGPNGTVTSARVIEGAVTLRPISEFTARRWLFTGSDGTGLRTVRLTFRFAIVPDDTAAAERTPIFRPPYEIKFVM